MTGIASRLHASGITPTVSVSIDKSVPHTLQGNLLLMGKSIIIEENDTAVTAHIRPDLMRVPALHVAAFYSCCELTEKIGSAHVDKEKIVFHDEDSYLIFCSMFMSKMFEGTDTYRNQESLIAVAEFLGWGMLFKESVYPTPGRADRFTTGVSSFLGPLLFNGSSYLEHYTQTVARVTFPHAVHVWDQELIDSFDSEYACHVDDDGASIDIFESSTPTSVSRAVRKVLTYHLPEGKTSAVKVHSSSVKSDGWVSLKGMDASHSVINPVNWRSS